MNEKEEMTVHLAAIMEKARDELSVFERAKMVSEHLVRDKSEAERLSTHLKLKTYHE